MNDYISLLKQSKSKIAELEEVQTDDYLEASTYALSLYNTHYKNKPDAVNFELCNSVAAVITQIDNMATGVIAELKKDVSMLEQYNGSVESLIKDIQAHNLEQRAKGCDDGAKACSISFGGDAVVIGEAELNDYANDLRAQAKALKEGKQ
jgi:hypothetical protein